MSEIVFDEDHWPMEENWNGKSWADYEGHRYCCYVNREFLMDEKVHTGSFKELLVQETDYLRGIWSKLILFQRWEVINGRREVWINGGTVELVNG